MKIPTVIASILGAGAMYVLDPDNGARRRTLIRQRLRAIGPTPELRQGATPTTAARVEATSGGAFLPTAIVIGPTTPPEHAGP